MDRPEAEQHGEPDIVPDLPILLPPPQPHRRHTCPTCARPLAVCLCHVIPSPPMPTTTHIVILHHPHESRHPLSTVPVLSKCLLNTTVLVHRRLTSSSLLPFLSPSQSSPPSFIYLFPPSKDGPSLTVSQLKKGRTLAPTVLIAFDATWKHAREMVRASEGWLKEVKAVRVCLDGEYREGVEGGSLYDEVEEGEELLVMRKEPKEGYVSTMEAVARVLGRVEEGGEEIERRLVGVLKEMVRLQKGFLKPMRRRDKMLKVGKRTKQ